MRVLRTVTSANSAATKKPLAKTSARMAARPKARWEVSIIRGSLADSIGGGWPWEVSAPRRCRSGGHALRAAIAEEVRVDELVDGGLIGRIDLLELQAHADAPVAPRHARLDLDLARARRQAEPHARGGARVQRARGADRNPAAAEIQRQRRCDRVAE